MQLLGKLIIKSKTKIIKFLNEENTGRISSIDEQGFPQIIPMNFVFLNDSVYMHSHIRGEKIENIKRNSKVGFEVDRNLEFLPSYFSDPEDASLADTLYISVVIKGEAVLLFDLGSFYQTNLCRMAHYRIYLDNAASLFQDLGILELLFLYHLLVVLRLL